MAQFYTSLGLSVALMFPELTVFALTIAVAVSSAVWTIQSIRTLRRPTSVMTIAPGPALSLDG